ncbi:hypothetical protein AVEN_253351-1, partial [Araneus ventricosus]
FTSEDEKPNFAGDDREGSDNGIPAQEVCLIVTDLVD